MGRDTFDYAVIGAGMGGLTVASLLAKSGARVCVLEAHEYPGGCCHSFPFGDYRFCAAVHYIFYCGEGQPVWNFLKKLGLQDEIQFERLDPDGYDRFSCPSKGLKFPIPYGISNWAERMQSSFPDQQRVIAAFFTRVTQAIECLRRIPHDPGVLDLMTCAVRAPSVFRNRRASLQQVFDELRLSPEVQAVLATQVGDLGLPPERVSFLAYCALIASYGAGAFYPKDHFDHFIHRIAQVIESSPGSTIRYRTEAVSARVDRGRIRSVLCSDGSEVHADRFISNTDPRRFVELIGRDHFPELYLRKTDYAYSVSSYTIYLGIRGIDLRDYGFGNWNVWHYPHLDLNAIYRRQNDEGDLNDPWLFLSTPTLHSPQTGRVCPEGDQILEIVTTCNFERFERLQKGHRIDYTREKTRLRDRLISIVERDYAPGLSRHVRLKVAGTPTTNHRYLWAPQGNIYGSELTPQNVDFTRLTFRTPIPNLFLTGASAEFPSIGATIAGGSRLYSHLTGDLLNGGRERFGMIA